MADRRRLFDNVEMNMTTVALAAPAHYRYLAMTANFWGMAKSEKDALRNVRGAGGKSSLDKNGYILYRVHPDTEIEGLGNFLHPIGERPIKVADHRK